jgi:glycosyltransferase involved in cell wall biosynthesis
MGSIKISAVIHTYNEEKNIERCLSSLAFVDEIVVIDMGSGDATCNIAKQFKARIYSQPYMGFADPARNFGLQKATGEWIVVVDADEEIPATLSRYLVNLPKDSGIEFYRIPRKNIMFGKWVKHTGWWPDYQIRYFRNGAVSWTDKIHGVPLTRGRGMDLEANENLSIVHYNYQTIEQFIERLNRYSTISAKEIYISNQHFAYPNLLEKPVKEFINRYFVWQGYKDGIHGLGLSLLQAFSESVVYLKLWELENYKEEKIHLRDFEKIISKQFNHVRFWLVSELLQQPHNLLNEIFWKIKKKLKFHG